MTRRARGRGRRGPALPTADEIARAMAIAHDCGPMCELEADAELAELEQLEDREDRG